MLCAFSYAATKDQYRRAMLRAIESAADGWPLFTKTTRTNGLRAIRTFEEVNGIPFDPDNSYHLALVKGMGPHAGLSRRLRLMDAK